MSRAKVAGLVLSAATLVSIALHEGYAPKAVPPVAGDVPTGGFGSTTREDDSPMRPNEAVPPTRALVLLLKDADEAAQAVRRCAPVAMYQHEFEAYVSLTYNIGSGAFCRSTLARKLNAGDYEGACREILRWDRFQGQRLRGLTLRREREHRQCLGQG